LSIFCSPEAFAKSPRVRVFAKFPSVIVSSPVIFVKSLSTKSEIVERIRLSVPVPKSILSALVRFTVAIVRVSSPAPRVTVSSPTPKVSISSPAPVLIVVVIR